MLKKRGKRVTWGHGVAGGEVEGSEGEHGSKGVEGGLAQVGALADFDEQEVKLAGTAVGIGGMGERKEQT